MFKGVALSRWSKGVSALLSVTFIVVVFVSQFLNSNAGRASDVMVLGDSRFIRVIGRGDAQRGKLSFDWPASGFEFSFEGSSATVLLHDQPFPDRTPANDWIDIELDGQHLRSQELATGLQNIQISVRPGSPSPRHHVRVRKRTEAEVGSIILFNIRLAGDARRRFAALPAQRPTLEAIGDSITAGFGVLGTSAACSFTPASEDALATYSALAAAELNFAYSAVAWSGKGVLQNEDPLDSERLLNLYDRAVASVPISNWRHRRTDASVVVVNLGTNDCAHGCPSKERLVAAYSSLLRRVRMSHPSANIVMILGPMLYDEGAIQYRSEIREALNAAIVSCRAAGDERISLTELWANPDEGSGCQYHPNAAAHRRFAHELAEAIRVLPTVR